MTNIINALRVAMALAPTIIEVIKSIEVPGNGPAKAAAVVAIIKAGIEELAPEVKQQLGIEKIEAFTTRIITIVVGFLNSVGIFQPSTK